MARPSAGCARTWAERSGGCRRGRCGGCADDGLSRVFADILRIVETKRFRDNKTGPVIALIVALVGLAIVAWIALPTLLPGRTGLVPTPGPSRPTPVPGPETVTPHPSPSVPQLNDVTVSTQGWKTFSSREYPITFSYPPDWELSFPSMLAGEGLGGAAGADGCWVGGCWVSVAPPGLSADAPHAVVLERHGFRGPNYARAERRGGLVGYGYGIIPQLEEWDFATALGFQYGGGNVVTTVPQLPVWTPSDTTAATTAAILSVSQNGGCISPGDSCDMGPPYDYALSTTDLAVGLAVGASNPLAERPESFFTFGGSAGLPRNLVDEEKKIVVTILASSRPNPGFDPTFPEKDASGRYKFWTFDPMTPKLGTDTSTWKTLKVPRSRVSVRVPPKWKVSDDLDVDGHATLKAPSGYAIDVRLDGGDQMVCRARSRTEPPLSLGQVGDLVAPDLGGESRSVEIWWQDATWHPVEVWLSLVQPSDDTAWCSQGNIDYGNGHSVYVGSADNVKNPTPAELNQAVAILASVTRL